MSHSKVAPQKVDSKTLATDLRRSHFTLGQTGNTLLTALFFLTFYLRLHKD